MQILIKCTGIFHKLIIKLNRASENGTAYLNSRILCYLQLKQQRLRLQSSPRESNLMNMEKHSSREVVTKHAL